MPANSRWDLIRRLRVKDMTRRILAAFIILVHSQENTTAEPTKETAEIQQ